MPWVYYPFGDDHKHAGKYYRGWMPAGDVKGMLERSGARLGENVPELGMAANPPKPSQIVTEARVIADDCNEAKAELDAAIGDLKASGMGALAGSLERTLAAAEGKLQALADGRDPVAARGELERIERARDKALGALGQSVSSVAARAEGHTCPKAER